MRLQRQRRGDFGGSWLCNRRNACQKSLKITHTSEKSNSTAKTQVLLPKSCPLPADEPLRCHPRRPTCRRISSANLPCISQPPSPDIRTYGSGSQLPTERAPPPARAAARRWLPPRCNQYCLFSARSDSSFRRTGWLHNCLLKRKPDMKQ